MRAKPRKEEPEHFQRFATDLRADNQVLTVRLIRKELQVLFQRRSTRIARELCVGIMVISAPERALRSLDYDSGALVLRHALSNHLLVTVICFWFLSAHGWISLYLS